MLIAPRCLTLLQSFALAAIGSVWLALAAAPSAVAADTTFQKWLEGVWPDAQKAGVSRKTFDMATRGLEPDLSLPDLDLPGRPGQPQRGQAEFVQTPADYVKETSIARLADQARKLAAEHRATLAAIEQKFGVPPSVLLAIWGRETDFGRSKDPTSAMRVLATQAYVGKRKDFFRNEFLLALKMLEEGHDQARRHAQLLGRRHGAHAVPAVRILQIRASTSTATAAATSGTRCPMRSPPPRSSSSARAGSPACTGPTRCTRPRASIARTACPSHAAARRMAQARLRAGLRPQARCGRARAQPASLLLPEGTYGPAFLTLKNYYVIKEYNFSDLYVLFVGHLSDRITDPRPFETPWSKNTQLRTDQVEPMQRTLTKLGLYKDKIDGKAGMLTRSALGAYQKANGLKVDCWPTAAVLEHMQGRARN